MVFMYQHQQRVRDFAPTSARQSGNSSNHNNISNNDDTSFTMLVFERAQEWQWKVSLTIVVLYMTYNLFHYLHFICVECMHKGWRFYHRCVLEYCRVCVVFMLSPIFSFFLYFVLIPLLSLFSCCVVVLLLCCLFYSKHCFVAIIDVALFVVCCGLHVRKLYVFYFQYIITVSHVWWVFLYCVLSTWFVRSLIWSVSMLFLRSFVHVYSWYTVWLLKLLSPFMYWIYST